MKGRFWHTAFGIALLIHLIILGTLGYALRERQKEEIQYIEVTMDELFAGGSDSPPAGGGQQAAANQDNNPPAPKVEQTPTPVENVVTEPQKKTESVVAEPQKTAENVADIPEFALNSPNTSTGSVGTGTGTGTGNGTGTGTGSGHGPGHGSKQIPQILSETEPDYPDEARTNGWVGKAFVKVLISKTGRVREVSLARSSGYECLDQSAIQWLRGVQFSIPYDDDGQPVNMEITVPVRFRIPNAA
jgi:periplasmic protein TonB